MARGEATASNGLQIDEIVIGTAHRGRITLLNQILNMPAEEIFTLDPGDVILTGTPAGVSRIVPGDTLVAEIPGVGTLRVSVA